MFRKEKKCKNTECDLLINYDKNPKKLFCDLKCKNRYHYLKDTDENAEIISRNKALKTNYKIIVNFIAAGVFMIDAEAANWDLIDIFIWIYSDDFQVKKTLVH